MNPQALQTLLEAEPFVPFTLTTTRAARIAVSSPQAVFLTRSTIYVGQDVGPDGLPERAAAIPLAQVTAVTTGE